MIEQITATASDPALGDTVLPRTANRRSDRGESDSLDGTLNFITEVLYRDRRGYIDTHVRKETPPATAALPNNWSDAG